MRLSAQQSYGADPERVHALLTDEAFLSAAAVEMGATSHRVAASPGRTAVEATIDSPPEVRAFVGPSITLVQETRWQEPAADGSRAGDVSITVQGAPVSLEATCRLAPAPAGSTLAYDGELTVRIPVFGGAVEKAATPAILEALEAQEAVAQRWLASGPSAH